MEAKNKEDKGGVAVNPTGMNVVCFSHFFDACLCLQCLQPGFKALGIVWIGSQPFGVRIVLRLFCWIPNSMWRILKNFENFSQPVEPVGKSNQLVH